MSPADEVSATLTLRAGADEAKLAWRLARGGFYRFNLFETPPTLSRVAAIDAVAGGVRLGVPPPGKWPRLPDLLRDAAKR